MKIFINIILGLMLTYITGVYVAANIYWLSSILDWDKSDRMELLVCVYAAIVVIFVFRDYK